MFYYAQLNSSNICIGVSSLAGDVDQPNMIAIETFNDDLLWRKYELGAWSAGKFAPVPPTQPAVSLEARIKALEDVQLANMLA